MHENKQVELETKANVLYESEQLPEAIALCNRILELFPSSHIAYHLLGEVAIKSEMYQEAVVFCTKSLEISECQPIVYCNLGEALAQCSRYEEAILSFRKSIELDPMLLEPYENITRIQQFIDYQNWQALNNQYSAS